MPKSSSAYVGLPVAVAGSAGPSPCWCDRIVSVCLAGAVLVTPWFMGGRHPWGQFILTLLVLGAALAMCCAEWRRRAMAEWLITPGHLLLLAAVALIAVQLLPLPASLLNALSPHLSRILPLWWNEASQDSLGRWTQVSVVPARTQLALSLFLTYGILFCTAVHYLRSVDRVERVLRCLAVAVVLLSGAGLLQYAFVDQRFFWAYDNPLAGPSGAMHGPFVRRDDFAHMLALGMGPLVWLVLCAVQSRREACRATVGVVCESTASGWRLWTRLLALVVALLAGLLTLSPGGVAMMLLAAVVSAGLMYREQMLSRRFLAGLVAALVVIVAVMILRDEEAASGLRSAYKFARQPNRRRGRERPSVACRLAGHRRFLGAGIGRRQPYARLSALRGRALSDRLPSRQQWVYAGGRRSRTAGAGFAAGWHRLVSDALLGGIAGRRFSAHVCLRGGRVRQFVG